MEIALLGERGLAFSGLDEQVERVIAATVVLYVLLAVASLSVMLSNAVPKAGALRDQVNSWWYIFPLVSLSLALYPFGPVALVIGSGLLALREIMSHAAARRRRIAVLGAAFLLLVVALAWLQVGLATAAPILLLSLLSLVFTLRRSSAALFALLVVLVGYGLSFVVHFLFLPLSPGQNLGWLFYLFVATALNDVGQFVFGKLFGKRKIASRISPNKTVEGLAGGVLVTVLVSLWLGTYLQLAPAAPLVLVAGLLSVAGFLGDISFSAAKRFIGVKDFSALIPGHGGILDRVDSLVFTAPILYFSVLILN